MNTKKIGIPTTDRPIILKQVLSALLAQHALTAAELSRNSGVPRQVLSLWLAGVEPRKLSQLKKVADVFSISVDELCFGRSAPENAGWIEGTFMGRIRRLPGSLE